MSFTRSSSLPGTPRWRLAGLSLVALVGGCAQALTPETVCGDGIVEGAEVCEPSDLRGMTCLNLGYVGGALGCASDCRTVDISGCTAVNPGCGDGTAGGTEACDGVDLRGQTCLSQGFTGGTLACSPTCTGFVTTGCTGGGGAVCGNSVAEPGEVCDGVDLRGQTCLSQGFTGGTLACSGGCAGFLTSGCEGGSAVCGNGVADAGEECDGADLDGATCLSEGFTGGTIDCSGACTLDTSGCDGGGTAPVGWTCDETYYGDLGCDCGCGVIDSDCASGALASCEYSNCATGDPVDGQNWLCDGSTATCGDGVADAGEDCDGLDLAGQDCTTVSASYTGGSLDCTVSCTFDTSGCSGGGGAWSCDAGYYGTGDGCDCGCGIIDPDCGDASAAACEYDWCASGSAVDGQNWLCQ